MGWWGEGVTGREGGGRELVCGGVGDRGGGEGRKENEVRCEEEEKCLLSSETWQKQRSRISS